jgi:hypothetical protein
MVGLMNEQEVLGRTNRLLSLIRHGPHWKTLVQQFFYCCVCVRYSGNAYTEPLPSNDRRHTQTATWSHKPALFFQNKESRLKIGKDLEGSGHDVIELISRNLPGSTEENRGKSLVRIVCVPVDIRTQHLQNTSVPLHQSFRCLHVIESKSETCRLMLEWFISSDIQD